MKERKYSAKLKKILSVFVLAVMTCGILAGSISGMSMTASASSKAAYLKSYMKLEKKCKKKFTYSGTQMEINRDAYNEYKLWDKELNRVYKKIKSSLSNKRANKLVVSERKWIKKRDKKAAKDASGWAGGTGYTMAYNGSLTDQTKSRIKWLIRNYA